MIYSVSVGCGERGKVDVRGLALELRKEEVEG